jgi:hypothetical protein
MTEEDAVRVTTEILERELEGLAGRSTMLRTLGQAALCQLKTKPAWAERLESVFGANRKLFVDVRQTSEGHRFDLYREATPEDLLPKDAGITRVTLDRGMTYEKIGIALASQAPEGAPLVVEIKVVKDVNDYDDSDCS